MKDLRNLDWNEIINRLTLLATSELGRTELLKLGPLSSPQEAQRSFREILEVSALMMSGVRPRMESLDLFSPWYNRLTKNAVLRPLELRDVRHFCFETLALSEILKQVQTTYLKSLAERLLPAEEPLSAIDQIMTLDGEIRSDASEKLHTLSTEKSQLGRQVHNTLERLVKDYQLEHMLQDRFVTTREGRWVLPIKSGLQHGFQGIVHAASQSKQTVFMEPQEVVPLNNRLREIEVEIEAEIERLLIELSNYLGTLRFQFDETRNAMVEADVRLAEGGLALQLEAQPCKFSDDEFILKDVRHPLLVLNLAAAEKTSGRKRGEIVTNSVELNADKRVLLLSGPNAGGKTVLLKAIGLAAQMARAGLPVCASKNSRLPFFNTLVVSIGDAQSVDANLSTFAAHLKTLDEATRTKGPQTLLLIDEICGSTDPEEGSALARGFIDTYIENGVFAVITSHLGALKRGWGEDSGLVNGSLDFDKNAGPTYRFLMGVPGQSLAIQTAKRAGVSDKIIEKAMANLSPELRKYQEAYVEVDRMKQELMHLQDTLSRELKSTQKEKERYEKQVAEFAREKDARLDKEVREAQKKVETLIQEVKVQTVFRKHEALQNIKFDLPKVIKNAGESHTAEGLSNVNGARVANSLEDFMKLFPSGSAVFIRSLGRDGVVQGQPNAKGEVPVVSNSMRLVLPWQDLALSSRVSPSTTQAVLRKAGYVAHHSAAESDRSVDLRGHTSEEAISELEIQLDAASLADEDRLKIIHGHGTDALKRSIRGYLSRSVYVKKWLAGTPETGGDGITWVELK